MGVVNEQMSVRPTGEFSVASGSSSGLQPEREAVQQWVERLNAALHAGNRSALASLFLPDGHWRDLFAFTWTITPCQGAENIAEAMVTSQATTQARDFAIAEGRTPPRRVQRAGLVVIEAILQFETAAARGYGVVRLAAADPTRAFQLMTELHELKGFEEKTGKHRPTGQACLPTGQALARNNFGGTSWDEQRIASQTYAGREPTVLVVGGGQAGLTVAATLGLLGVDTLVIDRLPRIGDCWRTRYRALALHNETAINHLPYMPFPPNWPTYLPKDMIAGWFEAYAWAMEINFWTSTELVSGRYDATTGTWTAVVRKGDGTERTLRPKHLIFANGLVGAPHRPDLPGLKNFTGDVIHTADFSDGARWRGRKALVVGMGSSAHDVAQDLYSHGTETTLIQRGSATVVSIDPSAKLPYAIYDGIPIEDGDLLVNTSTLPVLKTIWRQVSDRMVALDKKMIEGLIARGFKWDMGEDGTGHQMKIRTRYGGYILDGGCAQLIIDGKVGLLQQDTIERFVEGGALLKDGTLKAADLIVLATGFVPQQTVVRTLLGEDIANKVGPVWGIAPDGEMNNMWRRTAQPGLWFAGGSFSNCRFYSRFVALQIKAIEEGIVGMR
jgi:cation diffusion facilitator CzcD-associated flavoprotein CzcO